MRPRKLTERQRRHRERWLQALELRRAGQDPAAVAVEAILNDGIAFVILGGSR